MTQHQRRKGRGMRQGGELTMATPCSLKDFSSYFYFTETKVPDGNNLEENRLFDIMVSQHHDGQAWRAEQVRSCWYTPMVDQEEERNRKQERKAQVQFPMSSKQAPVKHHPLKISESTQVTPSAKDQSIKIHACGGAGSLSNMSHTHIQNIKMYS